MSRKKMIPQKSINFDGSCPMIKSLLGTNYKGEDWRDLVGSLFATHIMKKHNISFTHTTQHNSYGIKHSQGCVIHSQSHKFNMEENELISTH